MWLAMNMISEVYSLIFSTSQAYLLGLGFTLCTQCDSTHQWVKHYKTRKKTQNGVSANELQVAPSIGAKQN